MKTFSILALTVILLSCLACIKKQALDVGACVQPPDSGEVFQVSRKDGKSSFGKKIENGKLAEIETELVHQLDT